MDELIDFAVGALAELLHDLVIADVGLSKLYGALVELGALSKNLLVLLRLAQLAGGLRLEALVDAIVQTEWWDHGESFEDDWLGWGKLDDHTLDKTTLQLLNPQNPKTPSKINIL